MTRIFLNAAASSAANAVVTSAAVLTQISFPDVVAGNKMQYRFFLVDGAGGYDLATGDVTNYTLALALGDIVTRTTLISTSTFTSEAETIDGIATAGWQATLLDFSGAAVLAAVAGYPSVDAFMELKVTETATGVVVTYCQMKVQLRNRILS